MDSAARETGERQLDLARELVPRVLADAATAGMKPVVELELLAWLAHHVQEVTMEGDQVHCRVWPVCPTHGLGGHALVEADAAVWWCNGGGGHQLAPIGELGGSRG